MRLSNLFLAISIAFTVRYLVSDPLSFDGIFKAMLLLPFGKTAQYKLSIEWTLVFEVFII